jgi:DNA polymerase III delta subunit
MTGDAAAAIGYYWGDDEFALERAAERLGRRMEAAAGAPIDRWSMRGDARSAEDAAQRIAAIGERVGTATFFGGGTLAIVTSPAGLARAKSELPALMALVESVAPGNGLAFLEPLDGFGRQSATGVALAKVVAAAGGEARAFEAPKEGQMVRWIEERATERGVRLGAGAAKELATRIGAFVREKDVDRRLQGRLAASEIDKLALFRATAEVTSDDVRALVPEAIPGSIWALLDAIAERRTPDAVGLMERLVDSTPAPVLLSVIHRRIRELIQVGDLVGSGASPADIVRAVKVKPYPAEKLSRQTRTWSLDELESALDGLLELDVAIKGSDGTTVSEGQVRLQMTLWLAEHVARKRAGAAGARSGGG